MTNGNDERIIYCKAAKGYWTGARWGKKEDAKAFPNWDAAHNEMVEAQIEWTVVIKKK